MKLQTLQQFYDIMSETQKLRKQVVSDYLHNGDTINYSKSIATLKNWLHDLRNIDQKNGSYVLKLEDGKEIPVDLTYEIEELKKDIVFLEEGESAFFDYLASIHPNFEDQVQKGVNFLSNRTLHNFITDRDGTVNNYCGRYRSSIQSIYNAVFLSRFAHYCATNSVILTSAPLQDIGLADISTSPNELFIYAASKGREFLNRGEKNQFPIEEHKQQQLNKLNNQLSDLVKKPEYQKYALIGSGLQYKFGQTTIARQDVSQSIPESESEAFLETIKRIVSELDPQDQYFRIEDTGKDIEIILTIDSQNGESKDFDKGDGVRFLNEKLDMRIEHGHNLVCGDTHSDIAMAEYVQNTSPDATIIFVTEEVELQEEVKQITANQNIHFMSTPDILVMTLNKTALNSSRQ